MIREVSGNLLTADVDHPGQHRRHGRCHGQRHCPAVQASLPSDVHGIREGRESEATCSRTYARLADQKPARWPALRHQLPDQAPLEGASRIEDVASGLADLCRVIRDLGIPLSRGPPLGCGNGGLAWSDVRPLIVSALGDLQGVDVLVYPPAGAPATLRNARQPSPGAAHPRPSGPACDDAALPGRHVRGPSIIEVQKLMYFLQVAGEHLKLRFVPHHCGPYADNLRAVLRELEGQYISGFGDGSRRVNEAEPLAIVPGHDDDARRRWLMQWTPWPGCSASWSWRRGSRAHTAWSSSRAPTGWPRRTAAPPAIRRSRPKPSSGGRAARSGSLPPTTSRWRGRRCDATGGSRRRDIRGPEKSDAKVERAGEAATTVVGAHRRYRLSCCPTPT